MTTGRSFPRTAPRCRWSGTTSAIQLQRLTKLLQPTEPGGVSTLGALVNTAADNLRGQGANIRDAVIKLSQTFSALGDHSDDLFTTFKNLSTLVSALHDSARPARGAQPNMAAVTSLMADDPQKVGTAVEDLSAVVGDVQSFADDNREAVGTASDKLAWISGASSAASTTSSRPCTSPRRRSATSSTSSSLPTDRSPARWRSTTSPTRSASSAARSRRPHG